MPQSTIDADIWLYLRFIFVLIDTYILFNIHCIKEIRYGVPLFLLFLFSAALALTWFHFISATLAILSTLCLYVQILRLKFAKKS